MIYFIRGSDAVRGGSEEDYAQLYVGTQGALLCYVIKRDVDEQVATRSNLTQADFDGEEEEVKSLDEFQQLVNQHFAGQDIRRWFEWGGNNEDKAQLY